MRVEKEPADLKVELSKITEGQIELYHSPDWWKAHLGRSRVFDVSVADLVPDGWRYCAEWYELCARSGNPLPKMLETEAAMWRRDQGQELGLVRLVSRKR
jgi:hypothetical protein